MWNETWQFKANIFLFFSCRSIKVLRQRKQRVEKLKPGINNHHNNSWRLLSVITVVRRSHSFISAPPSLWEHLSTNLCGTVQSCRLVFANVETLSAESWLMWAVASLSLLSWVCEWFTVSASCPRSHCQCCWVGVFALWSKTLPTYFLSSINKHGNTYSDPLLLTPLLQYWPLLGAALRYSIGYFFIACSGTY